VRNVSFRANHGESIGIIGANGAGKSSLLKLIVGLLLPTSGDIDVGGIIVTRKTLSHVRNHVGFTFQNPEDQLFMNSVYEDVAFGPRNYGLDETEVRAKVMSVLDRIGIVHLADKPPFRLSGGEKRSAVIASVLAMDPDILLLDEPSSDLDPRARRKLIELINGFSHTKLITSHDLDFVLETCSRIIVLKEGSIAIDAAPSDVFSDEAALLSWGLEMPASVSACPICSKNRL
jgi:cobalt/nickel transport system ATP-binding protein